MAENVQKMALNRNNIPFEMAKKKFGRFYREKILH